MYKLIISPWDEIQLRLKIPALLWKYKWGWKFQPGQTGLSGRNGISAQAEKRTWACVVIFFQDLSWDWNSSSHGKILITVTVLMLLIKSPHFPFPHFLNLKKLNSYSCFSGGTSVYRPLYRTPGVKFAEHKKWVWMIIHFFILSLFHPKAKNVRIVAIGIGDYVNFQGQLEEIAGKNVYNTSNFEELSNLFLDILTETCSE